MLCKKCGLENSNDSKFCKNCGTSVEYLNDEPLYDIDVFKKEDFIPPRMEEEERFENIDIAPKKKLSLGGKIGITIGGILIVFIIVFLSLGAYMTNPENIVSRNFENFIKEDYDSIYYDIDIPASDFTKKEAFIKNVQAFGNNLTGISKYDIWEEESNDPQVKKYSVTYVKEDGGTYTKDYTLKKLSQKSWLFFDDYKISGEGFIVKDFYVYAPEDAYVYIDGIEIKDKYLMPDNTVKYGKVYKIPSLFTGSHKINYMISFLKDRTDNFNVYKNKDSYTCSFPVSEEDKEASGKEACEFLSVFFNHAISGSSFDNISEYLSENADIDSIKKLYNLVKDSGVDEDGYGIKSITLSDFNSKTSNSYTPSGCEVKTKFLCSVKEIAGISDSIHRESEFSFTGSASFKMLYEDGKYKITGLGLEYSL